MHPAIALAPAAASLPFDDQQAVPVSCNLVTAAYCPENFPGYTTVHKYSINQ